ncbi:hypothetical protein [Kaistia nematophila]|uniref:Uncharacterized protein n=1 Tax=Kaistia nematophila TaxID=2994654 RepID=A0A9X3E4K7_9HYPH|nr:hypothetical protein [Kaistia nematophila]MCX5571454.1 hypothetical protein [Kaistia nematophila]
MRTIIEMIAAVHDSTAADWIALASLLLGSGVIGFVCGRLPG